jgi:protein-S-isoprenylcysteine O-methyltransferase Ste14
MKNNNPSDNIKTNSLLKIIVRVLMIFIFLGLLLFLTAGSANYNEAWIYILSLFLTGLFVIGYFYKKDPEFIGGRILKRREKEETSKSIQNILSIPIFIGLLIPGLDYRFGWSDVPLSLVIISVVFVLAGYMIIARVMEENRYASSIIEISNEQKVIESGPYKIIRHPMYTGGLLFTIFTPLALGSYWALISFSATSVLGIILRIINEEKFLKANLQGYDEYCRKTKYHESGFT